jgi:hypothetical protein
VQIRSDRDKPIIKKRTWFTIEQNPETLEPEKVWHTITYKIGNRRWVDLSSLSIPKPKDAPKSPEVGAL